MLSLSAGNKNDASEGRELLETVGPLPEECETVKLLMDKGYEDNKTRKIRTFFCPTGTSPCLVRKYE
jgi:hypothetical protein